MTMTAYTAKLIQAAESTGHASVERMNLPSRDTAGLTALAGRLEGHIEYQRLAFPKPMALAAAARCNVKLSAIRAELESRA